MDIEELQKRREKAMQTIRPLICKKLDKILECIEEEAEDDIIEALVDAGIDGPITDPTTEEADAALEMVQQCWGEALKFWCGEQTSPVYAVVSYNPDNGLRGIEVEFFGSKPRTWAWGDDKPLWFRVYEGNLDGGDSAVVDSRGANFG